MRLTSAGALAVYISTTLIGTSSAAFASPGWHWVGVRGATGTSVVFLQIDGADEVTGTATVTAILGTIGASGSEASAVDLYLDDLVVDSAGFLAPSKVDIAFPTGCTAGGATDGNGGTTNIWEGVNNAPPIGVASASEATNPNASIRFPASTAVTFVATLETYTALGVGSSDTVLAVRSFIRHGEDIATGSKNGTLGAVTNPTISDSLSFLFGLDSGAHGVDSASSLLWVTKTGTLTTSPTVTVGTAPTLTVSRASESRVGCIDQMGLLVVWTPAAAAKSLPPIRRIPIQLYR